MCTEVDVCMLCTVGCGVGWCGVGWGGVVWCDVVWLMWCDVVGCMSDCGVMP